MDAKGPDKPKPELRFLGWTKIKAVHVIGGAGAAVRVPPPPAAGHMPTSPEGHAFHSPTDGSA